MFESQNGRAGTPKQLLQSYLSAFELPRGAFPEATAWGAAFRGKIPKISFDVCLCSTGVYSCDC